jgi:hypothetical protein
MHPHLSARLRRARTWTPGVLCALLAIALAMPGLAIASHKSPKKRPASVPSCKHFSLAKMAQLLQVGSLEFEGASPLGNACTYKTPHVAGHYADLLSVSVVATPESVFLGAEQRGKTTAAREHGAFGTLNSRGVATFYVITDIASQGLGPCRSPGATLPEFGPPLCEGQPSWSTTAVYSYATLRPRGPKAFVSVGLADEPITGGLDLVTTLNKKIVSGQIR